MFEQMMSWIQRCRSRSCIEQLTACSPVAFGTQPPGPLPEYVVWTIAGGMLVVGAICWLPLRKAAARAAAANARIPPLQAALDVALGKIKGFADSQGRFVGNLALEIREPLAIILIHADLLRAGSNEPATVERYAKSVAEDSRHLSDLVESYLRLARPFTLEDTSHHVPVHFHDLVLEAVRRCQVLAATREVSVVPLLAESVNDAALEVLGDAVLLEAMIENLVRNSLLSAPRGTRVDLHVRIQGDEVLLAVRDHGARIDNDDVDSMFEGFFLVPAPTRPTVGTGLGLAIAKRVAEHHRGTISLRNVPGGGVEFEIQLPRWRPEIQTGAPTTG